MSIGEIIATCVSLASLGGIIFAAGGIRADVQRLDKTATRMQDILDHWQALQVRIGMLERFTEKNTSDIRALIRADNEVRVELASIHEE